MLATFSLARATAASAKGFLTSSRLQYTHTILPSLAPAVQACRSYATPSSHPPSANEPASQTTDETPESTAKDNTANASEGAQKQPEAGETSKPHALATEGSLAASYFDLPGQGSDQGRASRAARGMSSIEKRRQLMSRILMGFGLVSAGVGAWSLSRPFDLDSTDDKRLAAQMRLEMGLSADQNLPEGLAGRFHRCKTRVSDLADFLNKPAWDPLLPPPLPPSHQRPYTLVIELDDLLVHSNWTREHGWRTAKRPGIEEFLGYLSQFYEIVIFTEAPHYTAMPLLDKIDPLQYYFVYRLFRDSTRYYNKSLVKDLSYLGRDLSKVIMLDTDPTHTQLQPENSIVLPRWSGNPKDVSLASYLPFLEAIGINSVPDVRSLITAYKDKDIPVAFAERQAEYKRKHIEEWEKKKQSNPLTGFSIGSFFGLPGQATKSDEPPPTFFEAERKKHMELYQAEKNFFKANEAKMLETMEADRQRQMKEMGSSFLGFVENLGKGNVPAPPEHGAEGQQPPKA